MGGISIDWKVSIIPNNSFNHYFSNIKAIGCPVELSVIGKDCFNIKHNKLYPTVRVPVESFDNQVFEVANEFEDKVPLVHFVEVLYHFHSVVRRERLAKLRYLQSSFFPKQNLGLNCVAVHLHHQIGLRIQEFIDADIKTKLRPNPAFVSELPSGIADYKTIDCLTSSNFDETIGYLVSSFY